MVLVQSYINNVMEKHYIPYSELIKIWGFNKIEGMSEEEATDERSFANKPILARMFVIAAGSAMNFILPILLLFVVFMSSGYEKPLEQPIIGKVVQNAQRHKRDCKPEIKL